LFRKLARYAASAPGPRSGLGGATTVWPFAVRPSTTPVQDDASAQSPCTSTTVGLSVAMRDASLRGAVVRLRRDRLAEPVLEARRRDARVGPRRQRVELELRAEVRRVVVRLHEALVVLRLEQLSHDHVHAELLRTAELDDAVDRVAHRDVRQGGGDVVG